jgi:hypothetical protein
MDRPSLCKIPQKVPRIASLPGMERKSLETVEGKREGYDRKGVVIKGFIITDAPSFLVDIKLFPHSKMRDSLLDPTS